MPEGEETPAATPEPAAPPEAPEPVGLPESTIPVAPEPAEGEAAAETTPEQPASDGPDLSDANAQLREIKEGLIRSGALPQPEEGSVFDRLQAQPEYDPYDPYGEREQQAQPQQQQGELTEDQRLEQEINQRIEERAQAAVMPYLQSIEQERREERITAFASEHPRLNEPEVLNAVSQQLDRMADRYQNPALRTDPDLVQTLYFAFEARQAAAGQPASAGATAPAQDAATAVGQQGVSLETGAGPGSQDLPRDPVEEAYLKAIAGEENPFTESPYAAKSP